MLTYKLIPREPEPGSPEAAAVALGKEAPKKEISYITTKVPMSPHRILEVRKEGYNVELVEDKLG